MGQRSKFDLSISSLKNGGYSREEEMQIIKQHFFSLEKKQEINVIASSMKLSDNKIICHCGTEIYDPEIKKLINTCEGSLYRDNDSLICIKCRRRLFFKKTNEKEPNSSPPPRKDSFVNEISIDSSSNNISPKSERTENNNGKKERHKKSYVKNIVLAVSISSFIAVFLIAMRISTTNTSVPALPPKLNISSRLFAEGSKGSPSQDDGNFVYDPHNLSLLAAIDIDFSECLSEYAINNSDTVVMITSIMNQIMHRKISIYDSVESYIVDEMYSQYEIDLRDKKKYKDFIRCLYKAFF